METAHILSHAMTQPSEGSDQWAEADFRAVYLQHYPSIVGVLVRLLGDRARAEGLANEVFWKLYREPALPRDGNLGGWLYRTATNRAIDDLRACLPPQAIRGECRTRHAGREYPVRWPT